MFDLASLLEDLPIALFATDNQGRVTFCNGAAGAMLGAPAPSGAREASARWLFYGPDGRQISLSDDARALSGRSGEPRKEFPAFFKRADGMRRLVVIRSSPLREMSGASAGALHHIVDVTEKNVEEVKAAALAAIVEGSNDAIISKTLDEIVRSWNAGAERMFGYAADEMIGRSITRIIPPEMLDEEQHILEQIRQGQRVNHFDTQRVAKDGRRVAISLTVSPLRDALGNLVGASKVARDITERIKAQEAVAQSAERFRLLAKATNDIVRDWDIKAGTMWWNEGLSQVFGYEPKSFGTSPEAWKTRIHVAERDRVIANVDAIVAGEGLDWNDEYRFLRADGSWATVVDRGFIVRDAAGAAVRLIASMLDVTERRELDARLRQSQKLEAVGMLTGGVAHDFNNLLTVILGNAEALSENLAHDQRLRGLAEMTTNAAERAAELTNRLLAFARRQPLEPKAVDVNKLITGLDPMLRRTLGEHIEIETVGNPGLWPALIDPNQLENAVLNLAINARDAMPEGGRLTFESGNVSLDEDYASMHEEVTPGQYVMLAISDSGSGMDRDTLRRAFEPFFTTKGVGSGSGLGLSMVYGFVKQSLGHVKIYSELGHGTTVKLYLPMAGADLDASRRQEIPAEPAKGSERILLVEDNPLVRSHVCKQLEGLGYHVVSVTNGVEAVATLTRLGDFDLLFTDVVMPGGMNGRQLADEARKLRPGMPVLFTSGYTQNAIVHHGRLDRGVHLLNKPFRLSELAAKVRTVIDEREASA